MPILATWETASFTYTSFNIMVKGEFTVYAYADC